MDEYIEREDALKIIDNYSKACTEEGKVVADAIRDIIAVITPTADVVPRTEVFKIDKEKVSDFFLKKEITTSKEPPLWEVLIMNVYGNGYADAVREIFAELEFDIAQLDYDSAETRAIAIEGIIAALKKKYTEKEGRNNAD